ncbi:MAG: two-component regulator propeller domain-containing protein [Bacteroidia bacterium]
MPNKKHVRFLISLYLLTGWCLNASAQQPAFRNFQVKDGLPSSEVYDVMQDSKGYMWFCTDAGVSRYDGYSFRNFSNPQGLPDNTVFGAYEDKKGRIWFRSMSGKLSYFLHDSIYTIGANSRINKEIAFSMISSLCIDSKDTLWCGVSSNFKGYIKIAPPYGASDFTFVDAGGLGAFLVKVDEEQAVWGGRIYPKEIPLPTQPQYREISKKGSIIRYECPKTMTPNTKYIRTHSNCIYWCGFKEITASTGSETQHFYSPTIPISLFSDKEDNLWAGFYQDGVILFEKGNLSKIKTRYLEGMSVSCTMEDSEGGRWFSTIGNGVFYMASDNFLYYDINEGPLNNKVTALFPLDSASVLAGLSDGTIYEYSSRDKNKFPFHGPGTIFCMDTFSGSLLVGCQHAFRIDLHHPSNPVTFSQDGVLHTVKCLTHNNKGDVWGGVYSNLLKLDPGTGKILLFEKATSRIISIACDDSNTVWLGCVNGLWTYHKGKFTYWGDRYPLLKNCIEDLYLDKDGVLWMATKGAGLIVFKNGKCVQLSTATGLSSNLCKSVTEDKDGIIWLGTNKGIDRITPLSWGSFKIEAFTLDDGLPSNEIYQVVRNGHYLWAASNAGLIYFDTRIANSRKNPPPVFISSCEVNYHRKDNVSLQELNYSQNFIRINFVGLCYKRGSGLRYRYRLEGLDTVWNYSEFTTIQYSTLPPGDYTFKVYAINSSGLESPAPATLHFHILKPFWLKLWFITMCSILSLTLIYLIYTQRLKILKRNLLREDLFKRKISEIELKALRAQMNPHFIFNCIASIQNFILKSDTDSANKYLSKFSRLIRLVLINSTHEYISLENELETLGLYLDLEQMRFQEKFRYVIVVDKDIDTRNILIAPLIIQPYVENAIWHGLMHLTARKGELMIDIRKAGDSLKCTIEDNGIGRKKSMESKTGSRHKSLGMSITKERLENINAIYKSKLSVNFIDKYDSQGLATGTVAELFIPLAISNKNI